MTDTTLFSLLKKEIPGSLEKNFFERFFQYKKLKKGAYFIKQGHLCKSVAFIEKGIVLYYKIDETGEFVCDFAKSYLRLK
ncbi:hypothetical protein [Sphingobacterium gobiense]|uniref:Cyclic nucleotide-binding domain-containing protein n=1 Tax=Sphingobacterium gobiense TaxID=1382456 RepID=A0A2S9JST4_9SPHI|nr:hypothetical protein [Sphingobacterium gobiense]PRD56339.1 hypothetical protein C5749_03490 [Sphingobacterium gobiense]